MTGRGRIVVAVVAGLLALAGAGMAWWYVAGRDTGASAGGGSGDPDTAFAALECKPRLLDDRLALAVVFSQPLDGAQNLGERLRVTDLGPQGAAASAAAPQDGAIVRGSWTLGENPRIAYFPYVQPQRRFRIEVSAELQSVDGKPLGQAHQCEVTSEAMPPSWYFASRGVVLPARQNGGLPIVTVNQPEVDVQFLKVDEAELPRFFERVLGTRRDEDEYDYGRSGTLQGRVSAWELDRLRESTRSVYLGRFRTDDTPNRRHVSFLPVESIPQLQDPGVYIAVMGQPGRFGEDYQVTYFYVSDIGLHARRYTGRMEVFATSLRTGSALGGIEVEILDTHARRVAQATADREGRASFPNLPEAARLVVARQGGELSVVALQAPGLDLSEFDVGGHLARPAKLFAYAGRDLYRPGERFTLSVLARDPDGRLLPPAPLQAVLKRPDGRTVQTMTWRPDDGRPGYFQHELSLPADAPTGRWLLELRTDPSSRQPDTAWGFQVEEFLPERMKLDLRNASTTLMRDQPFTVDVQGDYLFGAPAAGNRLLVASSIERARLALPQAWPGFVFGDTDDDRVRKREELPEVALDERGRAQVSLPVSVDAAQSPLRVRGSFSLLESGGRPVVRSIERTVWPAAQLLAVRPLFDRDVAPEGGRAGFELIRVDAQGAFVPLPQAALRLVREDRQYHWRFDDQRGWHSGYTTSDELVDTRSVALTERTTVDLPVRWGRYRLEVDDPQTGLTLRYRFYAGWNAQDAETLGNRPDRVLLKLAQAPLRAGQTAELHITPPHDGTALVTVEGDRLLWSRRIEVTTRGAVVQIPIEEGWARHDLYATVTAFRPGSQGDRVTPARAVGLIHLPLARDDRAVKVSITAPAKVEPEKRMLVKVRAEGLQGARGLVTVSAVDVGILNITRYASPAPLDFFFGKHRYTPEMLDLYGKLIEKMDGTTARLAYGGDSSVRDTQSLPRKVKLVDLFSGPVTLDERGEAEIPLDIPDFNGTLRLMAVVSAAERFGSTEAETVSAAPVVAELSTPRFISPGDAATLALDVTNLSGAAQTVTVKLVADAPVRIVDGGERTLQLNHQQRQTVRFAAEATDAYGLGRLRLEVRTASGVRIERESFLQVQPPVALEREVRRVRLEPGQSLALDPAWVARYFPGSATVGLSVSNRPPLNISRLVEGLLAYPYGCLEQTTSSAYPHVFIDEAGAKAVGLAPRTRVERARAIDVALGRIAGLQRANGGYTLWGDGPYETWLSAYVQGFLQDARTEGFEVPESLYRDGQAWLLQQLQQAPNRFPTLPASAKPDAQGRYDAREYQLLRDSHQRFAELAHVAYVLARDQRAPLATLRYLHDQVRDRARSPLPLVHLSIALRLMGDEARADVALNDALQRPYGIHRGAGGYEWLGDYGSELRDLAMSYALLARHAVAHPRRENLVFDLARLLPVRPYLSTQERLALFLAARAAGGADGSEWRAELRQGEAVQTLSSRSTEQRSLEARRLAQGVSLTNRHSEALFIEVETEGYLRQAPAPKSDVIELQRQWFDLKGQPLADGQSLRVGDMLIARVQVRARQRIEDGLVVDRIPAGFEVENLNLSQGTQAQELTVGGVNVAQAMADARIKHREFRDDRYVAAARLDDNLLNVFYLLRVVSPGRYVVPAPFAEDMYRPELRGIGTAQPPVNIVDPRR